MCKVPGTVVCVAYTPFGVAFINVTVMLGSVKSLCEHLVPNVLIFGAATIALAYAPRSYMAAGIVSCPDNTTREMQR